MIVISVILLIKVSDVEHKNSSELTIYCGRAKRDHTLAFFTCTSKFCIFAYVVEIQFQFSFWDVANTTCA